MGVSRRNVLAGALVLSALALPAAAQKGDVIIATTGGLMEKSLQEHFYKRFEAETGRAAVLVETDETFAEREDQLRPPAALMVRADLGDEAGHD